MKKFLKYLGITILLLCIGGGIGWILSEHYFPYSPDDEKVMTSIEKADMENEKHYELMKQQDAAIKEATIEYNQMNHIQSK